MPARIKQLKKEQVRTTTPSDLLAELHVYIVPIDKWIPFRRLARNTVVEETVSAGFVRVPPLSTLLELRDHLQRQLEFDIPEHFVFIKSVGRNFTQVKANQEQVVKVKNFLPPQAVEPEIHVLELSEDLINKSGSVPNLLLSDTELSDNTGLGTARTGRLTHRGEESRRISATLGLPVAGGIPGFENELGPSSHYQINHNSHNTTEPDLSYRVPPDNQKNIITLDYDVGRLTNGNGSLHPAPGIRTKKRIKGERSRANEPGEEDEHNDDPRTQVRKSLAKRNSRLPKRSIPKADLHLKNSSNGFPHQRLSDLEANEEELEEKSDSFSDSYSRISRLELPISSAITVLNGSDSQKSFRQEDAEDAVGAKGTAHTKSAADDIGTAHAKGATHAKNAAHAKDATHVKDAVGDGGKTTKHKFRSRKITRHSGGSQRRRSSVHGRPTNGHNSSGSSQKSSGVDKARRTRSEDRSMYAPHMWTIQREANHLTGNCKYIDDDKGEVSLDTIKPSQARLLIAEHEAAREELKNQEAKKFEEQIKKEEEMAEKFQKKGAKHRTTEILNLEGKVPVHEVLAAKTSVNNVTQNQDNTKPRPPEKQNSDIIKTNGYVLPVGDIQTNDEAMDGNIVLKGRMKRNVIRKQPAKGAWADSALHERKNSNKKSISNNFTQEDHIGVEDTNGINGPMRPLRTAGTAGSRKSFRNSAFGKKHIETTLQEVMKEKTAYEDQRIELFTKARALHEEILAVKEKRRQKWWDEYNTARRQGTRLEERQGSLRQELEGLYRRVIGSLMRKEPFVTGVKGGPSKKASYKISIIRLRHEIADLIRRAEAIDIKLKAETRLRQQAEHEVKLLRSEVSRKKANVALTQSRAPHLRNIAYIPEDILIRL